MGTEGPADLQVAAVIGSRGSSAGAERSLQLERVHTEWNDGIAHDFENISVDPGSGAINLYPLNLEFRVEILGADQCHIKFCRVPALNDELFVIHLLPLCLVSELQLQEVGHDLHGTSGALRII